MKQKYLFIFFIFILSKSLVFSEKVLIFTYSYNRPDFIEIQDRTFKQFLKDDYEFIVFNDANNEELCEKINQTCAQLKIRCIRIPQEIHRMPYLERWPGEPWNHPTVRNSNVVQYSLDNFGFEHSGIVALFDSDLFLIKDFSIQEFLKDFDLAGVPQARANLEYLWIGLVFLNMTTLPDKQMINFNCGRIGDVHVDAGGQTYHYLINHPSIHLRKIASYYSGDFLCDECRKNNIARCTHNTEILKQAGFNDIEIKYLHQGLINCEFMHNQTFLHYRGGSNWDYQSPEYHQKKTQMLHEFIHEICSISTALH
jgi:hypothetical protein